MLEPTPLYGGNAEFLDALYEDYLTDPARVPDGWRALFRPADARGRRARARPAACRHRAARRGGCGLRSPAGERGEQRQAGRRVTPHPGVDQPRTPAGQHRSARPHAAPATAGARPRVLWPVRRRSRHRVLYRQPHRGGAGAIAARDILAQLQFIYAGTVGAEFAHMSNSEERLWLQDEFQEGRLRHRFSAEERRNILWQLTRRRGARALPAHALRRTEALLARGRGCAHPAAR